VITIKQLFELFCLDMSDATVLNASTSNQLSISSKNIYFGSNNL